MQISKYVLAAGIFVAGLSPVLAQSDVDDAEERARAREQLNQKMAELESQLQQGEEPKPPMPPSETVEMQPAPAPAPVIKPVEVAPVEPTPIEPAPVVPKPVEVKPVVVTPPPAPQPVVKPAPAPAVPPVQPGGEEAIARAREEMRSKIAEMNSTPAPTPNPIRQAPKVVAPPAPKAAAPQATAPAPALAANVTPADSEAIARARAATRAKIAELNEQDRNRGSRPGTVKPAQPVTATAPSAPAKAAPAAGDSFTSGAVAQPTSSVGRQQAEAQAMKASTEYKAPTPATAMSLIQAPAPAISAAKQIRLNELLGRYKADKITPEEYHAERAKILAEP